MVYKVLLTLISSFLLLGCASNMTHEVATPTHQLITDKNKAYIVFLRPSIAAQAMTSKITEFQPNGNKAKFVGVLSSNMQIIYPIEAGTHYFYMNTDMSEGDEVATVLFVNMYASAIKNDGNDILKATVKSGQVYVVNIEEAMFDGWKFKPVRSQDTSKSLTALLSEKTVRPNNKTVAAFHANSTKLIPAMQDAYKTWVTSSKKRSIQANDGFAIQGKETTK